MDRSTLEALRKAGRDTRRAFRNLVGAEPAARPCVERRGDLAILDDGTAVLSA